MTATILSGNAIGLSNTTVTMSAKTLFDLPIIDDASGKPVGQITATLPKANVYLLTFSHGADNRLTTPFCTTLTLALDILAHRHPPGVVVTTSALPKFYSNGLDLAHAESTPGFWAEALYPLWRRLMTWPGPTVALVNGHAFAGGLMVAMSVLTPVGVCGE